MAIRTRRRSTLVRAEAMSSYVSAVIADGAVGYWPLSELVGTIANDRTANGRNGTYSGNFTLGNTQLADNLATSAYFDGTDDYVSIADDNAWSCAGSTGTISLEAWIKPTAVNRASQFIIAKHEEWQLRIESDGRVLFDVNYQGLSSVMNCYSGVLTPGQVYHIIATYNKSLPRIEIYVNGILEGSSTSATGNSSENRSTPLLIGGRSDNGGNEFQGTISDVAVYSTALTAGQAAMHSRLGHGLSDYEQAVLADSPGALWPMQEASGSIVDVISARTGTSVGATKTYQQTGPVAGISSISFDGSSSSGFSVVDDNLWSSTSFSIEGWVYMSSAFLSGQSLRYWFAKEYSGYNEWQMMVSDYGGGAIRHAGAVKNTIDTAFAQTDDPTNRTEQTWYHVVYTFNGSSTGGILYINGSQVDASAGSGSRRPNGSGVLTIGWSPDVAARSWKGRLSMIAFYSSVLTPGQVLAHYQAMS